jgi:hypothetical protein
MRHHLICIVPLLFLTLCVFQNAAGQDEPLPTVGLSASFQGSQFDILVPIWTSDRFSLAPAFGLLWAQDGGSDIRFALAPRFFFSRTTFAPYVGGRLGVLLASPKNGDSTTDWIMGLAAGGEYFVDPHFSVGVESQLNLTISAEHSGRFGNPGRKNLNTGAAVMATVYF